MKLPHFHATELRAPSKHWQADAAERRYAGQLQFSRIADDGRMSNVAPPSNASHEIS